MTQPLIYSKKPKLVSGTHSFLSLSKLSYPFHVIWLAGGLLFGEGTAMGLEVYL
jgi:hypothetical protein